MTLSPSPHSTTRARILIADDNPDTRQYLYHLLAGTYEVLSVGDGETALAMARKHLPNLVLADVVMPRLDGLGLLHALQADPLTYAIPVILISARSGEEAQLQSIEAGATDYLSKPFSARELLVRIAARLDTAARSQRESLEREHARMKMIFDNMPEQFFALDREWRFTYLNSNAAIQLERLGKDPANLIGKVLWDEFADVASERTLRQVMSKRTAATDVRYYAPLEEWLENHICPSPDGGVMIFQKYVTQRIHAEEAFRKSQEALAHVTRLTAMNALTVSIAHELNQPLSAIATNAGACLHWLRATPPKIEQAMQASERIVRDAHRAGDVIAHTRALVRNSRDENCGVNMTEVTREVLVFVRAEIIRHGIEIHEALATDLPLVWGDRIQLQQVVLNLILNAIDSMKQVDHKRDLIVGSQRHESDGGDGVLITVQDTGKGFTEAAIGRLFDPFYTTKPGGLGMGLSISQSIIQAHSGRLWATTKQQAGAAFHVILPVWQVGLVQEAIEDVHEQR